MMLALLASFAAAAGGPAAVADDFEGPLALHWTLSRPARLHTADSGDPAHRRVLVLEPDGDDVYALAKGTAAWTGGVIEGDVRFPSATDSYLGILYGFRATAARTDFGVLYVKGNESYAQANPHRDFNVGRTLYPEYRVALEGAAAIRVGEWQHFKLEAAGGQAHLYVGDMTAPQMTFPFFEGGGALGLQPRSVGGEVWVDNVTVRPLSSLSYAGPARPAVPYAPSAMLTSWTVAGPLARVDDEIARRPDQYPRWQAFACDPRGAVVTGAVTSFHGDRTVAYFRTRVSSPAAREAVLRLSTIDDLALWVNGRFWWFVPRAGAAWYDFLSNPQHAGARIPIRLAAGDNDLVVRVRGGAYATGGFFAAVEEAPAADERMRGGRYAEAVRAWADVLARMSAGDPKREDLENRRALYGAVADVPPPAVSFDGDAGVTLRRNELGSWNVPVEAGGRPAEWIFDTGANLSTLAQSEAERLGLTTRDTPAYVRGSTGARNAMRLAVASEVRVGPARLSNVLFLVLADEALSVAPVGQQIRGILGMPALHALGRFSVDAFGLLRIGVVPDDAPGAPFRFEGWSPIVEVAHAGHPLRLLLDTGANHTSLLASARAALTPAEQAALTSRTEQTGGAGGAVTRTIEVVPSLPLRIGDATVLLRDVSLLPRAPEGEAEERDGTLGMDALAGGFAIDFATLRFWARAAP